ncbi:fibronectin type III domain-containing protein 7-like, partial [Huso huso]
SCVDGFATVTWNPSSGATSYRASATTQNGTAALSCTTKTTGCQIMGLKCGAKYTVHVFALAGGCESVAETTAVFQTVPCTPTNVTADAGCSTDSLSVSWSYSSGALMYFATVEGSDGTQHACVARDTQCQITALECGQSYTVYVTATNLKCNSSRSSTVTVKTAPCDPQNIVARLDCITSIAIVYWDPSPGAESYTVMADGSNDHVISCNTPNTTCQLNELDCGQLYNVTVLAQDSKCSSTPINSASVQTVPCVPDNLTVQMQCATNSALLSWDQSNRSLEYFVSASGSDGEKLSCISQEPGCTIDGLTCGTIYSFTVTASNGVCNSSFSVPVIAGAVPCPAESVALSLLLLVDAVQEAKVGWSAVQCAGVEYSVEMHGLIEDDPQAQFILTSYWTRATYFFFPVPCSSTYNVTVTSRNSAGIGYPSPPVQGLAVPCPPKGVTFYTEGTSQVISWNASVHAMEYVVYSSKAQRTELCRTSHFSCTVPKKQNDTIEVTAVNSAGESEPSVEILVQDTNLKRRRRDLTEDTGTYEDYTSPFPTLAQL